MTIGIDILSAKSLYHGIGVYVSNLLPRIFALSPSYNFIVYSSKSINKILDCTSSSNIKWKIISSNRIYRLFWEYVLLPVHLRQAQIDILWGTHYFLPPVKICKYIVTIHDLTSFLFPQYNLFLRRFYHKNSILASIRYADCIIVDSQKTKQDLLKIFPILQNKIKVIYCGVDSRFHVINSQEELLRCQKKYMLPEEFIFTLGVLEPKKNIEGLVRAYAELKRSLSRTPKLVIGGPIHYGWKNDNIFRLVYELSLTNDIIFTDFIEHTDLPVVYNLAKIFVFPSFYEGFGLPVIEAMACGVPVITSNVSSLPEVAGNAAILVNPYDVNEIAQAIKNVLLDKKLQQEMREKGIENAKRFSWQKSAICLLEVFENVCKQ